MDASTCFRFCVERDDLHTTRLLSDPDAPSARALVEGEVRLRVQSFALTANNITYAAFGDKTYLPASASMAICRWDTTWWYSQRA